MKSASQAEQKNKKSLCYSGDWVRHGFSLRIVTRGGKALQKHFGGRETATSGAFINLLEILRARAALPFRGF
jgi:hypothetical protein